MTSAEFNNRYQLVRQVTDGDVRTYHAVAPSGAVVMVHMLNASAADVNRTVAALLERLDPAEKPRILEVTEVDGSPVIVTRFILEFTDLVAWLSSHETDGAPIPAELSPMPAPPPQRAAPPRSAPAAPPSEDRPPPASAEASEFSMLFRAPPSADGSSPTAEPPAGASSAPSAAEDAKKSEPGEFTRMFRAQQPDALPPQDPAPPDPTPLPPQAPPVSRTPPPMQAPPASRTTSPPEPPVAPPSAPAPGSPPPTSAGEDAAEEHGEFTRLFRAFDGPMAEPAEGGAGTAAGPPSAAPPSAPQEPPLRSPAPTESSAPPPGPASPPERAKPEDEPGDFTRMFRSPATGVPADPPPNRMEPVRPPAAPPPAASPPPFGGFPGTSPAEDPRAPEAPAEEGEFTRMIRAATQKGASAPPPSHPPASPPASPPAEQRQPSPPSVSGTGGGGAGGQGEFTAWFAKQTGPAPSSPGPFGGPPPAGGTSGGAASDDYLSRLAGGTGGGASAPPPSPPGGMDPWAPPPAAPPPRRGPGEYTRIFSAPPPPGPGPLPPPPAPAPAGPSRKLLVGGLIGLGVLAILIVVLFALLAGRGTETPPADAPADSAVSAPAAGQ